MRQGGVFTAARVLAEDTDGGDTRQWLARFRRVQVASRRAVDAVMSGRYRTVFRGRGVEFEEVRAYAPGDEIRSIDWKVTARMGRPFVKVFREERELCLMLLVDVSASTLFGARHGSLRELAAETAAVMALSALDNNDRVGLTLFSDRVERHVPPKKGPRHVWRIISELLGRRTLAKGTDFNLAAEFLGKVQRRKSVVLVLSDFLAEDPVTPLVRLAARHDVIAGVLSDPSAAELPATGPTRLADLETGQTRLVDCADPATRRHYARAVTRRREALLGRLAASGLDSLDLSADRAPAEALRGFFLRRERRPG